MTRYELSERNGELCAFDTWEQRIVGECLSASRRYPANKTAVLRWIARLNNGG